MKNKITFLILFIIIFILFLSINRFLFNTNTSTSIDKINLNNSIFNIISETDISLDKSNFNNIKSEDYKNITNKQIIWKWFFINNSWEFFTNKHIFNNISSKYFITINNKNYNFKVIKKYETKDLILWKIYNYKNKYFLNLNNDNIDLNSWDIKNNIFIYKNNKLINWEIIWFNKKIIELNLNNLIETNIKLESWDSWSPLFNNELRVIWINTAIKKSESISYAQIINQKTIPNKE